MEGLPLHEKKKDFVLILETISVPQWLEKKSDKVKKLNENTGASCKNVLQQEEL